MDVDRKIGQLFAVPAPHPDLTRHVRDNHVGGVIWFATTAAEAKRVNAELQSIARIPLLVSADLEAGMGMRFTDAAWWPPAMALAATGDVTLAEEQARITAIEALAIGVNHILAPVADVNLDPRNPVINTRSFGDDPAEVARYVAAYVRGIEEVGCLATAKHFPGHGDTRVDSHRSLPVLHVTRERLDAVELVPFRAAIEAGVSSIMIGHLAVPLLDPAPVPVRAEFENVYGTQRGEVTRGGTMPATLSKPVIDLLRRDLRFDGLVITDAMDMGALAAHFDPGEAAVRAIEAGEDQILYSPDTDAAMAAVKAAVRSGRIAQSRIDESVDRVLHAKSKWSGGLSARRTDFRRAESPPLHSEIAQRSIKIVRDTNNLLPLKSRNIAVVPVSPHHDPLHDAVRALGGHDDLERAEAIVLLLAIRPKSGAGTISVPHDVRALAQRHAHKTVAVSFGSPYILAELGEVSTFVCAWGVQPVLQLAAVRAIRG